MDNSKKTQSYLLNDCLKMQNFSWLKKPKIELTYWKQNYRDVYANILLSKQKEIEKIYPLNSLSVTRK